MKKPRHDSDYLADLTKAAELAVTFVKDITKPAFEGDPLKQSAVLYQLAIVGEAAKNISKTLRHAHPEIPWQKMAGLRNILVHAYHEMDIDVIWKTVQNSLPALLVQLKALRSFEESR